MAYRIEFEADAGKDFDRLDGSVKVLDKWDMVYKTAAKRLSK
jgi:hypothetical protein